MSGVPVSYFAAAVVRATDGWEVAELDLAGVADVDEVADRLRDQDPDAELSLLFIESDDAYLAILRLDNGEDLRIFGSDSAFVEESRLGALLLGDLEEPALEIDELAVPPIDDEDADDQPAASADADPLGDADLLADLGIPAPKLLALCAHEGMLPADVIAEICQVLGCGDALEELREV